MNITLIKSLINFDTLFDKNSIYEKDIKDYIKTINKGSDILISTRIVYDDRIIMIL